MYQWLLLFLWGHSGTCGIMDMFLLRNMSFCSIWFSTQFHLDFKYMTREREWMNKTLNRMYIPKWKDNVVCIIELDYRLLKISTKCSRPSTTSTLGGTKKQLRRLLKKRLARSKVKRDLVDKTVSVGMGPLLKEGTQTGERLPNENSKLLRHFC